MGYSKPPLKNQCGKSEVISHLTLGYQNAIVSILKNFLYTVLLFFGFLAELLWRQLRGETHVAQDQGLSTTT